MNDCSNHKKELFGETDMKKVAEAIGDLHYETLEQLLIHLADKFQRDYLKDEAAGKIALSKCLLWIYYGINKASEGARRAWQISKPFMTNDKKQ